MKSLQERMREVHDENPDMDSFEKLVENKLSTREDLHAFLLIDKLLPGDHGPFVCAAEHDIIYLDVDAEELNEVISDDQVKELVYCGLFYDEDGGGLAKFV